MKRTDSETEQKVIQSYLEGNSLAKTAKLYGIQASTVRGILIRYGVPRRTMGGIDPIPQEQLARLYRSGVTTRQLAKKYNCTPSAIDQHLQKAGVAQNYRYKNHDLDVHYFQNIDSPDKAYFLGYLLADGSVGSTSNAITMMLSAKDKYVLDLLNRAVHSSNKIHKRADKDHYSFCVKCVQWKQDLAKYGIVPRKTFTADLPILSDQMMPHMLRGLIDGDGWVSYKGQQMGLCGTQALVTHVRDFFVEKLGIHPAKVSQVKQHLWQVCWTGKKTNIKKIGQYIYANKGQYYLQRKYLNFCKLQGNTEVTSEIAKGSEIPQSVEGE